MSERGRRRMDPQVRRRVMASIRKKNTKPELALRSALWRAGIRGWRCHVALLPGTPDVAFPRWKLAVHVDGVWWHGRSDYFTPGKRGAYWDQKIERNKARDHRVDRELADRGWTSLRFWDVDVLADSDAAALEVAAALRKRGWQPRHAASKPS